MTQTRHVDVAFKTPSQTLRTIGSHNHGLENCQRNQNFPSAPIDDLTTNEEFARPTTVRKDETAELADLQTRPWSVDSVWIHFEICNELGPPCSHSSYCDTTGLALTENRRTGLAIISYVHGSVATL
jgi:hypothetical protein